MKELIEKYLENKANQGELLKLLEWIREDSSHKKTFDNIKVNWRLIK